MCGRFAVKSSLEQLKKDFGAVADENADLSSVKLPSFNIAPGSEILILTFDGLRRFKKAKWGLVPSWSKEPKTSYSMINARAESLAEKPSFSLPFRKRRCAVIADGYFEWKREGKEKIPFYIYPQNGERSAFAGIFDIWSSEEEKTFMSVAIITLEAQNETRFIHNRMPAFLGQNDIDLWMDNSAFRGEKLEKLLRKGIESRLAFHRVTKKVNSPVFNTPECIEPLNPDN